VAVLFYRYSDLCKGIVRRNPKGEPHVPRVLPCVWGVSTPALTKPGTTRNAVERDANAIGDEAAAVVYQDLLRNSNVHSEVAELLRENLRPGNVALMQRSKAMRRTMSTAFRFLEAFCVFVTFKRWSWFSLCSVSPWLSHLSCFVTGTRLTIAVPSLLRVFSTACCLMHSSWINRS